MKTFHIILFTILTGIWIWSLPILLVASFFMMPFAMMTTFILFLFGSYIQYTYDGAPLPDHWIRKYMNSIPWNEWFPCNQLHFDSGIIACHPHGLLCCGALAGIHFVPKSKTCMCIAPVVFYVPVIGILARYLGCIPATKLSMTAAIEQGYPVLVVPGGVPEIVLAETGIDTNRFKRHGFMRIANQLNVKLFAVVSHGECATYNIIKGPCLDKRVFLSWLLNVPIMIPLIFGYYGSWLPKRVPIKLTKTEIIDKTKKGYQQSLEHLYMI